MLLRRRVLTLGGAAMLPVPGWGQGRTLVIAAGEIPPYASERAEDNFLGALFDQLGPEMGLRLEMRFMPWPRCEAALDDLSAWGAVPYVVTPEREKKYLFSAPLYAKQTRLFYFSPSGHAPVDSFNALTELRTYRIGGVRGYYYEQLFRDAGIQMDAALSEELNFRKLRAGRVDFVAAVDTVGWALIRRLFPAEEAQFFHTLDRPLHTGFNHLMTSMRYPLTRPLLDQFNAALERLRRNGAYRKVSERFGLPPG